MIHPRWWSGRACPTAAGPRVRASLATLPDAVERGLQAFEQIGVRGILVHAASSAARTVYLHMGWDPSARNPNTLMVRLADVAAARKTKGQIQCCHANH